MKKLFKNFTFINLLFLIIGTFLMGMGTSLSLSSTLSGDAVAFLWDALSEQFGITVEMANSIFTCIMFLFVIKLDIRKLGIGTIVCPILQNLGIITMNTVMLNYTDLIVKYNYLIGLLGISLLSIGCGIFIYGGLGTSAYLGFSQIVSEKLNINFGLAIMMMDGLCFVTALVMMKTIAIGPLIATVISGPLIDGTIKLLKKISNKRKDESYANNISM